MDHGWIVTLRDAATGARLRLVDHDAIAATNPVAPVRIDDLDTARGRASRLGVAVVREVADEPRGVRRFFIRDAAGTVVDLLDHR